MAIVVDLTEYDTGRRHWLHPLEKMRHRLEADRAKRAAERAKARQAEQRIHRLTKAADAVLKRLDR